MGECDKEHADSSACTKEGIVVRSRNVAYYDALADQYSLFFTDLAADMEREGSWLDAVLRARGVRTVLDASCGSGRQAIPLAARGYEVTAADPCGTMLERARCGAADAGLRIAFRRGAFTDLPAILGDAHFDAVIALGNGLCHQESREEIVRSLRALRSCCCDGGLCLVGIKDFDAIRRQRRRFHGHRIVDEGGERRILFEVWDFEDPILVCGAFSLRGNDSEWSADRAETREYMLGALELAGAAEEAGFASAERLPHPCEAVYLLEPGATSGCERRREAS
jgi:SAM-dependent methyltransferase